MHSRPAALLGTVALCIRFAERWGCEEIDKKRVSRQDKTLQLINITMLALITLLITLAWAIR